MIRKTGYVLAGFVITGAILVAASRLLIPILDEHRADFEVWASTFLDMPVKIEKARVSWYQYYPVITLNEVTLLSKKDQQPLLQIEKIRVFFSIPKSIWRKEPVLSGVMISGAEVNIYEKPTGEIAVQGFPAIGGFSDAPYTNESRISDVLAWLSQQPRLVLHNVDLSYTNKLGQKRFLALDKFRFQNSGNSHSISGKVLLRQDSPTEFTASIKWEGASTDINKIDATVYVFASGISLPQWLKGCGYEGWQINSGAVNAKVWANWHQGSFNRVQSEFEAFGLNLYSALDKSTHKINRLNGDVGWKREGNQIIIAGDDIFIDLPGHLWPATNFYVALQPGADNSWKPVAFHFGYLDLKDIQQMLVNSTSYVSNDIRKALTGLHLTGEIHSLSGAFVGPVHDIDHLTLNSQLVNMNAAHWKAVSGLKGLSGALSWNGPASEGNISLQGKQTSVRIDSVFLYPITLDKLTGDVAFRRDEKNNYLLTLKQVNAVNADVDLTLNGTLRIPETDAIEADLKTTFTMPQVKNVTHYLPMKVFEPGLIQWLQKAFLSGAISAGDGVLRGKLVDFPFENTDGQFIINAKVGGLDFHYAPGWPDLNNLSGKVIFNGKAMTADVASAEMLGINIVNVQGVIADLAGKKPAILEVKSSDIKMDFKKGMEFVRSSPLQKTIGSLFSNAELTGPLSLKLNLTVPLATPDDTTVLGDISFKDVTMNLAAWRLKASDLQGKLQFTEKSTSAEGITGQLFNKPFVLGLSTLNTTKDHTTTRATISNHIDIADLEGWLHVPFAKVVKGNTDLLTNIDFQLDAPIQVHLSSNLQGVQVMLPDQYAKPADKPTKFTADLIVQNKQPIKMKINYNQLLDLALLLESKRNTFELAGVNVRIGSGSATWPEDEGLFITGNIPSLDYAKIQSYMGDSRSSQSQFGDLSLSGIDVTIGSLKLPGQPLTNARIKIDVGDDDWDISINSVEMDGDLQVPAKWSSRGTITADFKRLELNTSQSNDKSTLKVDSKSLPSISFNANNVSFNNMPLGQVSFKTSPNGNGQMIRNLSVSSPRFALNAAGSWSASGTTLKGTANSPNVSQFLSGLGFDVHNFVSSKGRADFQLNWSKPPFALSLATMNGQASLDLAQGRIVEVSQTSGAKMDIGRMLNIFSLQTIPRRLSLDFSDVTQKGYSFDSFRGDFRFENGNAYTNNTRFNGPVAKVSINGRIGLASKDYDMTLSVTPYVTSSIPVAATLITANPAIGVAAWAVDKVISQGVSKVTTYYYAVRGSWANPVWSSVRAPSDRQ